MEEHFVRRCRRRRDRLPDSSRSNALLPARMHGSESRLTVI
jgi:hypothetical protein